MEHRLDARLTELPPSAFHRLTKKIGEVDECKGWWQGRGQALPSVLGRMRSQALAFAADSVPSSSGRGAAATSRTSGYATLLESVFDGHRDLELGEELILRIHAQLFRSGPAGGAARGRYRTLSVRPPAFLHGGAESPALRPTEPHLVSRQMELLTGWTVLRLAPASVFHPLLVIPAFLLEFLAIRPFADGNTRLSRVLAALLLLKSGYRFVPYLSLDQAIAEREMEYAISLRRAQARRNLPRPDISSFLLAFLDVVRVQAGGLRRFLEDRPREELLSGNQRAALELLARHREVSIRLVRRELGIPRDTAKQTLRRLCELNLVRRAGAGRAARYLPVPPSAG